MEKDPAKRFQSADELADAVRPYAERKAIQFDFRELVTLRAKQAKAKAEQSGKKSSGQRSSITSASGWLKEGSHQFAEATDSFSQSETPAIRPPEPDRIRIEPVRSATLPSPRPAAFKGPAPPGWRLQILGTKRQAALVKARTSIGSAHGADLLLLRDNGVDSLQCWLEYDGQNWKLHQESKTLPTYVNGKVEALCNLYHGSKITFGGKAGVRLISIPQAAKNRKRTIGLFIALIVILAVSGLALFLLKLLHVL
ncbi:MAG: FHA domain-containing protein [Planctomycetaceae bacterium]